MCCRTRVWMAIRTPILLQIDSFIDHIGLNLTKSIFVLLIWIFEGFTLWSLPFIWHSKWLIHWACNVFKVCTKTDGSIVWVVFWAIVFVIISLLWDKYQATYYLGPWFILWICKLLWFWPQGPFSIQRVLRWGCIIIPLLKAYFLKLFPTFWSFYLCIIEDFFLQLSWYLRIPYWLSCIPWCLKMAVV